MTRYHTERSRMRELEPSINRTAIQRIITELTEPQLGQLAVFLKYYFDGSHRGIAPQASPQVKTILIKLFDSCNLGSPNSSKSPLRNAPLAYKFEKMGKKHQNFYFIVHGSQAEDVLRETQAVMAAESAQKRQTLLAEYKARQAEQDAAVREQQKGATTKISPEHSARILYEQVQNLFINLRLNSTTVYEFQLNNANDPFGDHLQARMQAVAANPEIADTFRVTLFPNAEAAQTIRISWAKRSNNVNVRTKKLAALEKILMQGVTVPVVIEEDAAETDNLDTPDLESETAADAAVLQTLGSEIFEGTSTFELSKAGIINYIMERLPTSEFETVTFEDQPEVVEFVRSMLARSPGFYIDAGNWYIEFDNKNIPYMGYIEDDANVVMSREEFRTELEFYMNGYYILPKN